MSRNICIVRRVAFVFLILGSRPLCAAEVSFESDIAFKSPDQPDFTTVKAGAGQKLQIRAGDTLLILPKQGLPVLLVVPRDDDSRITLTNANFSGLISEVTRPELERSSNEIIDGLRRADTLIQKRDYAQASQVMAPLKDKYPRVSSVQFMSGTIHYLLNDNATAIKDLERGLQIDPENEDAKRLLLKLKGNP